MIVNIEAQNDFYPGYPLIKRALYYCSRMISSQYGTEFTKSHYENIKKVYSIWICLNPPESRKNTITSYSIAETPIVGNAKEDIENYDLITAIMICLGPKSEAETGSLLSLLNILLSSNTEPDMKKKILSDDFHIPMTQQSERRMLDMCNLSEDVWQKGIEEGIEKGMVASIKNLMDSLHMTAEQAMNALKISEDDKPRHSALL